jgi:hypothetical protein
LAPQLCAYRGEEPGGYSQIEDYKGGSQEDPGLYGKVGEQVHGQSPSAILSFEFFFQLILLPFANLDLLASSSSAAVIQGVQPAVFTYWERRQGQGSNSRVWASGQGGVSTVLCSTLLRPLLSLFSFKNQ